MGSVDSVDSVAIHSERGAYRDSLLVVSSRIVKRYKSKSLHAAPPVDMLLRSEGNHRGHRRSPFRGHQQRNRADPEE